MVVCMIAVDEAAGLLGVSERRMRAMLHGGQIRGEKVAGRWLVAPSSLSMFRPKTRPMAPGNAMALATLFDGGDIDVHPEVRRRLQRKLDMLRSADDPAVLVASWLAARGDRKEFWAADSTDLRKDPKIRPSGFSDPRSQMSAPGSFEGYVAPADLDDVIVEHWLVAAGSRQPKVFLHIANVDAIPFLYLIADLMEHGLGRDQDQARKCLAARL